MAELDASKQRPPNDHDFFKSNLAEFEKAFRELKSELYMKRNEVTKLKSELEGAHHEIHSLNESAEKLKKNLQENKITMEMFMKRTQDFEPKYYEKRDALIKLELQYKMETSTNNALREDFQKLTMEKSQLLRKVDMLEEKQRRDLTYNNDISQKLLQLKNVIAVIKSDIQAVKEEQHLATILLEKVDLAQESALKCREMSNIIANLKQDKDTLEEQYIKSKAKCEKLTSIISANNRIINEENLEAKILLMQCKKMSTHYKEQIHTKNEILSSLNNGLFQEKDTNLRLIEDNENKCRQLVALNGAIEELQTELNVYKAQCGEELEEQLKNIKFENETIEIKDSQ